MTDSAHIPFSKMHGAWNDFIYLHEADLPDGWRLTDAKIAQLCDRRLGIGADGTVGNDDIFELLVVI